MPHILVFVICVRIGLPEKTNGVRRRTRGWCDLDEAERPSVLTEVQLLSRHLGRHGGLGGGKAEKEQSVIAGSDERKGYMLPHSTCPSGER